MFAWGVLSLTTGFSKLEFKNIWKELVGLVIIIIWAAFGNAAYSHEGHHFDWFFITGSTFPFVPKWLMPFAVLTAVFGMFAIILLDSGIWKALSFAIIISLIIAMGYKEFFKTKLLSSDDVEDQLEDKENLSNVEDIEKYRKYK